MAGTEQGPYIPQSDSGIRDWVTQFANTVALNPAECGLTQADSDVLSALAAEYNAAYVTANTNSTRTNESITEKDVVRNQAVETFRVYAQQIKQNLGVSEAKKNALGIHLNDETKTPIPAPVSMPVLSVFVGGPGVHVLRYVDSATPDTKAKPAGAIQMFLYRHVGPAPTTNPDDAEFFGIFTKNPIQVEFQPEDASLTSTYFARWVTRTGLMGPWSLPVAMQIAFGGPVEEALITGGTPQSASGGEDLKIAA